MSIAITITEPAARELRTILSDQPTGAGRYLRISVKVGGCSGFTYVLDLCVRPEETDRLVDVAGFKILLDPISRLYLDGLEIDFREDPISQGFVFNNPNAKETCRCGVSFGI